MVSILKNSITNKNIELYDSISINTAWVVQMQLTKLVFDKFQYLFFFSFLFIFMIESSTRQ